MTDLADFFFPTSLALSRPSGSVHSPQSSLTLLRIFSSRLQGSGTSNTGMERGAGDICQCVELESEVPFPPPPYVI